MPKTLESCICDHAHAENNADSRANSMNGLYEGHFEPARTLAVITAPVIFVWLRDPRLPHEKGRFWFGGARQNSLKALRRNCDVEFLGHFHQICDRVGLHLLHHLTSVCFDCFFADAELASDLFVQEAGNHQRHDLSFPWSE